jgi:molybdopterin-guanine dinucleotide biosynthesis protein B
MEKSKQRKGRSGQKKPPPLVCIVGGSGSGKTTYLERLIPELRGLGLRVGTIKHHPGDFEMDVPGKDSWRHRQAGAVATMVSAPGRIGLILEVDHDHDPEELTPFISGVDIVIAEGYKRARVPKIEIFRPEVHHKPFCADDDYLMAIVTDADVDPAVPRFPMDDVGGLAAFLAERFGLDK